MDQASLLIVSLKMIVALGFVLCLFGGALYLVRRFAGTSKSFLKRGGAAHLKPLEIMASQNLGPGRNVYLIRCLDKRILIGATNTSIQHLADIEEPLEEQFSDSLGTRMHANSESKIASTIESTLRDISRV